MPKSKSSFILHAVGIFLTCRSSIARHCCPLSPSSALFLNHIFSHFLIPLSDFSLICTVCTNKRKVRKRDTVQCRAVTHQSSCWTIIDYRYYATSKSQHSDFLYTLDGWRLNCVYALNPQNANQNGLSDSRTAAPRSPPNFAPSACTCHMGNKLHRPPTCTLGQTTHLYLVLQEAQLPQRNSASAAHTCAADALFLCGSCIGIGTCRS